MPSEICDMKDKYNLKNLEADCKEKIECACCTKCHWAYSTNESKIFNALIFHGCSFSKGEDFFVPTEGLLRWDTPCTRKPPTHRSPWRGNAVYQQSSELTVLTVAKIGCSLALPCKQASSSEVFPKASACTFSVTYVYSYKLCSVLLIAIFIYYV